jgi:MFS family permease
MLSVAVVLADSSVVILALPEILDRYDVSVATVAWVLTAYNLVLALSAVPAAYLARGRFGAGRTFRVGVTVFALASMGCALAPSLATLIAARCVQAVGGAAVICAALELMPAVSTSAHAAARRWVIAGAVGTALGPAVGGALTQLISWQAIFVAQIPIGLALGARFAPATCEAATAEPEGRPHLLANAGLALVSAALTAALFLLVLLMINGWGLSPIEAAIGVSMMPVAAILVSRFAPTSLTPFIRATAGVVCLGGGLAALGLLPRAGVIWTLAPQVLIGIGLGLGVSALTETALAGRTSQTIHGGWTIAARHAGVVLGILILTPVFVADLDRQQTRAENAATALVLDARIDPTTKLALAAEAADVLSQTEGRVPDVRPAFRAVTPSREDAAAYGQLENDLVEQLRRAGTSSVARSFLAAALLALLALAPISASRRRANG